MCIVPLWATLEAGVVLRDITLDQFFVKIRLDQKGTAPDIEAGWRWMGLKVEGVARMEARTVKSCWRNSYAQSRWSVWENRVV